MDIWVVALQAIFDLLLHYGLETFGFVQNNDGTNLTEDKTTESASLRSDGNPDGNNDFVKIVVSLLDNRVSIERPSNQNRILWRFYDPEDSCMALNFIFGKFFY